MAHMYLCRPQSQVRMLSPPRSQSYLDDVVQQTGSCDGHPSYTALIATAGSDVVATGAAIRPTMPAQPWRPLLERIGYTADELHTGRAAAPAAASRSPSPTSAIGLEGEAQSALPPSYTQSELQIGAESVHSQAHRATSPPPPPLPPAPESKFEPKMKILHVHPPTLAAGVAAPYAVPNNESLHVFSCRDATASGDHKVSSAVAGKTKKAKRKQRTGQTFPSRQEALQGGDTSSAAPAHSSAAGANSSLAFALQFLVEYEALSRRDLIIDYYATFPSPTAPPTASPREASAALSSTTPRPRRLDRKTETRSTPPKKLRVVKQKPSQPQAADPNTSGCRHCRVVFPGSHWDAVLRHHRHFLQQALISDVMAGLPRTSVDVSSLHTNSTELEAIVSVREKEPLHMNPDVALKQCAFAGVWEVYNAVSSSAARDSHVSSAPAPNPTHPPRYLSHESPHQRIVHEGFGSDASKWAYVEHVTKEAAQPVSPSCGAPVAAPPLYVEPRVGGAPWRQSRQHVTSRSDAVTATQSELVVPIVFATAVTTKLRRAARAGSSGDLHVALRRDGLYAVPSAQEVRVRTTRVNSDGLYVELLFRWPPGAAPEANAEEAMDEAPFTDTWQFLEDCQPPTTTNVLSTVTKRDALAQEHQQQQQDRVEKSEDQPSHPPLVSRPVLRVDAGTVTQKDGHSSTNARIAHRDDSDRSIGNVACEVPLMSPEWRVLALQHPDALRAALKADIAQLAKEALAEAQLSVGSPRTATDGSVLIRFELDAVSEGVLHRVRAAEFPRSFPHLASLSPKTKEGAQQHAQTDQPQPGPQRVTAATSMSPLASSASESREQVASHRSSSRGSDPPVPPEKHKVTQMTQTALRSPMSGSESTVSENFSTTADTIRRSVLCAATQTSFAASLSSTVSRASSASISQQEGEDGMASEEKREAAAALERHSFLLDASRRVENEASAAPSQPVLHATEMALPHLIERYEEWPARGPEHSMQMSDHPSKNSVQALDDTSSSRKGVDQESVVPVKVSTANVRSYKQGGQNSDISLVSLQVTEAVPSAVSLTEPEMESAHHASSAGTRLSFSMLGDKWGVLLDEYPVLLKRALQADVQDLFGVPAHAVAELKLAYDDRLHVMVQVDPTVELQPTADVSAAITTADDGADATLPVDRLPHAHNLYDAPPLQQPSQQHYDAPPLTASLKAAAASAFSSTRRAKEASMVRRRATDSRAVLKGSLKAVSVATLESLHSPAAATPAESLSSSSSSASASVCRSHESCSPSSNTSRHSAAVSRFHVHLQGTMWHTIVAHQREGVCDALLADLAELLGDEKAAVSVEAAAVEADGRLRVDFDVPLASLPCGLNPPQFRWALERLSLTHLRQLHSDTAMAQVPATLQIRRFFDMPGLTAAIVTKHEATLRTLFVAETCAALDTADANVLQLDFAEALVVEVTLRAPSRAAAEKWQTTLMEHNYTVLTDFLAELAAHGKGVANSSDAARLQRRATLLSSSSLMVATPEASRATSVSTPSREAGNHVTPATDNSSAHAVHLTGPLWLDALELYPTELQDVATLDASTALAPLAVLVEKVTVAAHGEGVLFTFLLRGHTLENLAEVEDALQCCSYAEAKALCTRVQTAQDAQAKADAVASSAYAMELDGAAWLDVLATRKKALIDTFVLEALNCLRDHSAVTVPVGVAVREVVSRRAGVVLSYDVVSSASASAVDRFRVAEVVEQHNFPLLWELYDEVMLSREPFKHTTNPNWVASRRQRLLNTTYDVAESEPNPRTYSFVGYADQEDLELYLRNFVPGTPTKGTTPDSLRDMASVLERKRTAGQEEYDFKHLPAPSPLLSTATAKSAAARSENPSSGHRIVAHEEAPPSLPVAAPVARTLYAEAAAAAVPPPQFTAATEHSHPFSPPISKIDEADVDTKVSTAHLSQAHEQPAPQLSKSQQRRQKRQRSKKKHAEQEAHLSDQEAVDDASRPAPSTEGEAVVSYQEELPTLVSTEEEAAEEKNEDSHSAPSTEDSVVEVNNSQMQRGVVQPLQSAQGSPLYSPLPLTVAMGPIVIAGTLTVTPMRPPDIKPAPAPTRAKTVIRIPAPPPPSSAQRHIPAPPSRKRVDEPEMTSARQIEAPVRLRHTRRAETGDARRTKAASPVTEVARQPRSAKAPSQRQQELQPPQQQQPEEEEASSAPQSSLVLPRLDRAAREVKPRDAPHPSSSNSNPALVPSSRDTAAAQTPALYLPMVNRHSTAPITVMDVRMTHPPLVPPPTATAPVTVTRPTALVAGVSLAPAPLVSSRSRSQSDVTPHERAASKSDEAASVLLPVLHAATSAPPFSMLTLPPTNRPRATTAASSFHALQEAPTPAVQRTVAAHPATKVAPHWVSQPADAPRPVAGSERNASQLQRTPTSGPRLAGVERVSSVYLSNEAPDDTPPRRTASFLSPATSSFFSPSQPSTPVPAHSAAHATRPTPPRQQQQPLLVRWQSSPQRSDAQRTAAKPAGSPSVPDLLSNGPTSSHRSRTSPSLSRVSSSSLRHADDSSPQLALPQLRGDGTLPPPTSSSSYVAVTSEPHDRFRTLWQNLEVVEDSVRTRYPRMERELRMAASGATPGADTSNKK